MRTSRTFSIHFWLNLTKKKDDLAPIYARVTVDGKRAEISLKRETSVTYWDTKSKKTTSRTPEGKALNNYLDQVYAKLLDCHKQLSADFKLITAKAIKARFIGEDERHKTLLDLVTYHNENMVGVLKPETFIALEGLPEQINSLISNCNRFIYGVYLHRLKVKIMARQSISLTKPNDEWLKAQVQSEEYSSKSELVNDLIRRAREQQREVDWIRAKLVRAEENLKAKGYVEKSPEAILKDIKKRANAEL